MRYKSIYAFWVIDEIKNDNTVYVLDRVTKTVATVNDMPVDKAIAVLKSAEENSDRYEFWYEETEENENA